MWVNRWPALFLACLLVQVSRGAEEKELVWASRTRERPRMTQTEIAEGKEDQTYSQGFVPGHLGGASIPESASTDEFNGQDSEPALHGAEEGGMDAAKDATNGRKDIRKQFIGGDFGLGGPGGLVSAGVGGYGSFGGGAGLAGVGPVIPGGAPAAFGGLASHVGGPCGGVPCGPVPLPPPPPPPPVAFAHVAAVGAYASCPGGKSLEIECDAKRPWPQCPPQSYCYATNTADVGPYVCCPIWSTYGSKWRPRSAFYPYYPPMPYNWPPAIQATAGWPAQVAPAVAVPVPVPCAFPPCGGPGPGGPFGGPYANKKKKTVIRKILKDRKRVHKTQAKEEEKE